MTLRERLSVLKNILTNQMVRIKDALLIKGVKTPEHMTYSLVADYIRQIYQSEFNFVFNFSNIDQFGNPHVPNTGQSINGMSGILPNMEDLELQKFVFTTQFVFMKDFSYCGWDDTVKDGEVNITITYPSIIIPAKTEFNEQTVPEVLNYEPSFDPALETT